MPKIVHECGAKLSFPDAMRGRKGKCPTCGETVEVPAAPATPAPATPAPARPPGASSRPGLAPVLRPDSGSSAGQPALSAPGKWGVALDPPPNWDQYEAFLEGRGPNPRPVVIPANLMLKEEAEAKWEAAAKKGPPSKYTCPGCKTRLEVGAMVCMSCGLDLRSGRTLDGKTKMNEVGLAYLEQIPWLKEAPEEFSLDDDDDAPPKNKPRFPNLRKPRR